VIVLSLTVVLYRPLLLCSVSPELAAARGIAVRLVGAGYLLAMAGAVALAAVTIGAILSTALLVGPAATALRLTRRPGRAIAAAALIGVGSPGSASCWPTTATTGRRSGTAGRSASSSSR
jgi:zinc/manganese transport system permease protein